MCASEAIQKAGELQPDVVLIDTELEENGYIQVIRSICKLPLHTRSLVFTHSEKEHDLLTTMKVGARGYVSKDVTINDLVKAITVVADGGVIVSPSMAAKMLERFGSLGAAKEKELADEMNLSEREEQVFNLVAKGATNKEITNASCVTENTVKVHLRNILEKLHVHTPVQAAILAQKRLRGHAEEGGRR